MQKVTDPALLSQLNGTTQQAPQAPQRAPGFIPGVPKQPDPYQRGRDQQADYRANSSEERQQRGEQRDIETQGFNRVQSLMDDYRKSQVVKDYTTAVQSFATAMSRGEDGGGDIGLIYDYAKALDPNSAVREGEVEFAKGGSNTLQNITTRLKKEFGWSGGGVLPPEARAYLRREIYNIAAQKVKAYDQEREFFSERARQIGVDPETVIGPHAATPYVSDMRGFSNQGQKFTPQQLAERQRSGLPVPDNFAPPPGSPRPGEGFLGPGATMDNIAFDADTGTGAFGSNIEGQRLTAEQNAQYRDFLEQNKANLTPELLNAWWQSRGFGPLANAEEVVKAAKEGTLDTGIDYSQIDAQRKQAAEAELQKRLGGEDIGVNSLVDKGITLNLSDEIYGLRGGLGELLSGGSFSEGYQRERDVERAAQMKAREKYGVGPEIGASLLTPVGVLGEARTVGQFARQGAALGATAGFGQGEGAAQSVLGSAGGGAIGALGGAAASQAPRAINALMGTRAGQKVAGAIDNAVASRRPNVDADVIAAGERQGIKIRLPDAVESKRPAMAALEKSKTGAPAVGAARAEDIAATQARLQQITGNRIPPDNSQLGQRVQGALERQNSNAKDQTSAFYNRVEKMAPGARSDGAQTLSYIDDQIANLEANGRVGNASFINALKGIRSDIAESGVTVGSLQSLRRTIRQRIKDNNLDPSSTDTLFAGVDQAATAELRQALGAANPKAVGAFDRANQSHAERLAFRKEVARELLGTPNNPLDAEKAATRLMSKIASVRGDEKGFARVWETLDDSERADIGATLIHTLAGGDNFSLAKLAAGLENANERTLVRVFGKDGAEALRDIRLIARRKTQTQMGMNNSNTGSIVEAKGNGLLDTILGVFGYTQGGPLGAAAAVGARAAGERVGNGWRARLLLNPDFTKWLRRAPDTTSPEVINRYFDRLNKVASREQSFLMDARQLQQYLADQFSKSPGRAAADDNSGDGRGVEPR